MCVYIFLVISSLLIVKPVCNALFLSKFGAYQLPYVFLLVAFFAAAGSSLYFKFLKRFRLNRLIIRTFQTSLVSLLIFWALLYFNYLRGWTLYVFYVWVAVFAVISTSQFWLLANLVFNAREAKRLFGFIGAGAIAGGILGGYLTKLLAPAIGSENLLFVCMGLLSLCMPITKTVWKDHNRDEQPDKFAQQKPIQPVGEHPLKLILESRHLAFLAGIVAISVVVGRLVEYQFGAIATKNIKTADELTALYGLWLSNINMASLLIQLFVTRRVIGFLGVGTALFFLPLGILFGAFAVMLHPTLWSAILLKLTDGSLKQSINKAGLELMALPIAARIKSQAKAFIDIFVDSFATGLGGVLLLVLTALLHFSVREISIIGIVLLGGWIYLANGVRHEYIKSFRSKIERPKDQLTPTPIDSANESVFGSLIDVLQGDNEKEILRVLKMVQAIRHDRLIPCLKRLIHHRSTAIRLEALRNIYYYKHVDFTPEMEVLIYDKNQEVKTEAFHYLFQHARDNQVKLIQTYLQHEDYAIRGAALLCAARESRNNKELKKAFKIKQLVAETLNNQRNITDPPELKFTKINCIKVIGAANIPDLYPYLHVFLNDPAPEVLQTAIVSAGHTRGKEFLPVLIRCLGNKALWKFAHQALISFGPEVIIDMLTYVLKSPHEEKNVRLRIPKVISSIGAQKSVNILMQNIDHDDLALRFEIIKALNGLRSKFPILKFDEQMVMKRILDEVGMYLKTLAVLNSLLQSENGSDVVASNGHPAQEARQLFVRALEARLDNNLERIFRLLGLKYPPDDIYNAYLGIKGQKPEARVNALEFLDNVLEKKLKKRIVPIVEGTLLHSLRESVLNRFNVKINSETDALVSILNGEDNWLKGYALYVIGQLQDTQYVPLICPLINHTDPMVKKFAGYALKKMGIMEMTNGQRVN